MFLTNIVRCRRTVRLIAVSYFVFAGVTGVSAKKALPQSAPSVSAKASGSVAEAWSSLTLTDQEGRQLSLASLKGYTVLLNFIFTQCGNVCPLQTRQLMDLAKAIPADAKEHIRFVSVSVDPQHDTPQQLKAYAHHVGADQRYWLFLTGTPDAIKQFTTAFQAFDPKAKKPSPADHTTALFLFDRTGQMMQRYHGVPVDVTRLAREIPELDRLRAAEINSQPAPGLAAPLRLMALL